MNNIKRYKMKVVIDNQVIQGDDHSLTIRPIRYYRNLDDVKRLTWGSRLVDNMVLSLLATNDIQITELEELKDNKIESLIFSRHQQMLKDNKKNLLHKSKISFLRV